jgi:hypothetical protein
VENEISLGPHSGLITTMLDDLCYNGLAEFGMELEENSGPHVSYGLTYMGESMAEEFGEKHELRNLAEIYVENVTTVACDNAIESFSSSLPKVWEDSIQPVTVASTGVMFSPSRSDAALISNAEMLRKNLYDQYKIESEVGGIETSGSGTYVPLSVRIDPARYFSDLKESKYFGNPVFRKEFLLKSLENQFFVYLYRDSGILTYYSHPGFSPAKEDDSIVDSLTTSTHFANLCKRTTTSLHLALYYLYNPSFAKRFGSRGITYIQ